MMHQEIQERVSRTIHKKARFAQKLFAPMLETHIRFGWKPDREQLVQAFYLRRSESISLWIFAVTFLCIIATANS